MSKPFPSTWNAKQVEVASQHQSWLATKMATDIKTFLDKRREKLLSNVTGGAVDTNTYSGEYVRVNAAQLNEVNLLIDNLYDTEKFVSKINA